MTEWGLADDSDPNTDYYRWLMVGESTAVSGYRLKYLSLKATIPDGAAVVGDHKPKDITHDEPPGKSFSHSLGWSGGGGTSSTEASFTLPDIGGLKTDSVPAVGTGAKTFAYSLLFSQTAGKHNLPQFARAESVVEFWIPQPGAGIHPPLPAFPTIQVGTTKLSAYGT